MNHQPEPGIAASRLGCGRDGFRIIAVAAQIHPQITMRPLLQQVLQGVADHLGLAPGGNEYRRRPTQRATAQGRARAARCGYSPARLRPEKNAVDAQIIQRTQ